MPSKIYIVPTYGNFEGKLLVFDTVESMTHIKTAKIASHPVESADRTRADHRFRDGTKIQLVGMVSDNWNTSTVEEPTPVFKTQADKFQNNIRSKILEEYAKDSIVYQVVSKLLDKRPVSVAQMDKASQIDTFWINLALSALDREKDEVDKARDAQLSRTDSLSNNYSIEDQNSTITQARELLTDVDENSIICTVVSKFEIYENMVLTGFTNILRNGPQRGGYWVSLIFQEQLIASTVTNPLVVDAKNSEAVDKVSDKGKQEPVVVDKNDAFYREMLQLWEENLKHLDTLGQGNKVRSIQNVLVDETRTAKEVIIERTYKVRVTTNSDPVASKQSAKDLMLGMMLQAVTKAGKI